MTGPATTELALGSGAVVGFRARVDGARLRIEGGTVGGEVIANGGVVSMEGGASAGVLRARGGSESDLAGGQLGAGIEAQGDALVRLHVQGRRTPLAVTGYAGTLTSVLADATPFSIAYLRAPTATIELVPEPASLLAAGGALASRACLGRRKT